MSVVKELKRLNKSIQRSVYWNLFSVLDANCNDAWHHYTHAEGCMKDRWKKEFGEACNAYRRILGKVESLK